MPAEDEPEGVVKTGNELLDLGVHRCCHQISWARPLVEYLDIDTSKLAAMLKDEPCP